MEVYIGIGTNMGSKGVNIEQAVALLEQNPDIKLLGLAPLYRTAPVGYLEQEWFLNTVARLETDLKPMSLLYALLEIERLLGRERQIHWGPRVIDLDLLLYGDETISLPRLEVPHPRLGERAFVVVPLADLAPQLVLPGGLKAKDLAKALSQVQSIERYSS